MSKISEQCKTSLALNVDIFLSRVQILNYQSNWTDKAEERRVFDFYTTWSSAILFYKSSPKDALWRISELVIVFLVFVPSFFPFTLEM